jgi:hypothetical protein
MLIRALLARQVWEGQGLGAPGVHADLVTVTKVHVTSNTSTLSGLNTESTWLCQEREAPGGTGPSTSGPRL